jgi:hypothetical protein
MVEAERPVFRGRAGAQTGQRRQEDADDRTKEISP